MKYVINQRLWTNEHTCSHRLTTVKNYEEKVKEKKQRTISSGLDRSITKQRDRFKRGFVS